MGWLGRRVSCAGTRAALLASGGCLAIDALLDRPPVIGEFRVEFGAAEVGGAVRFRGRVNGEPGASLSARINVDGEGRRDVWIDDAGHLVPGRVLFRFAPGRATRRGSENVSARATRGRGRYSGTRGPFLGKPRHFALKSARQAR